MPCAPRRASGITGCPCFCAREADQGPCDLDRPVGWAGGSWRGGPTTAPCHTMVGIRSRGAGSSSSASSEESGEAPPPPPCLQGRGHSEGRGEEEPWAELQAQGSPTRKHRESPRLRAPNLSPCTLGNDRVPWDLPDVPMNILVSVFILRFIGLSCTPGRADAAAALLTRGTPRHPDSQSRGAQGKGP